MQISNEIKKPFSGPLLNEMVFNTKAELTAYLSNALRYAGMTVSCKEDNTVYVLNSAKNEWIPSGSVIKDRDTVYNKRSKIKFDGDVMVQDDPTNNETVVTIKPNNRLTLNEVSAFSIVGGNGQATLKWSDPQDKSENGLNAVWKGTRLLRKTGSYPQNEEDGVLVITNGVRDQYKDNGFTDLNLVNGTKYYYVLFPFTTLGTFTQPTIVSGREVTPSDIGGYDGMVLNFTASSLNNAIGLTWTNPDDSNYKGVKIVRSRTSYPSSHNDGDMVYMGNGTSYNDLGLLAETSYYYTAFAYDNTNSFNASGPQTVGVTLPSPKLGPVQNFTATAGNGLVVLKWTDPSDVMDNGKKVVTWFGTLIRRRTDSYPQNELDGTLVVENQIFNQYKDTGFTDVDLTNDTTYYYSAFPFDINNKYTVDTSTNSRNTAKPSASLGGIPAITNLSAIPGDKSVRLSWNNPSNSQDLNRIEIRMRVDSPINSITEGVLIATYSKPVPTTHVQNELTNGRNYYFKIFEYNNYNQVRTEGNESVLVTPTSASYTESIYGFYADPGDSNVLLSWVEPTSTEYIGVTIRFKTGSYPDGISDGYPVGNTGFFSKNTTSYRHTGLNNGTKYFYRAFTQNLQGNWNDNTFGQQVEATPAASTDYTGSPDNVSFTAGDGKVTIKFNSWLPEGRESEASGIRVVYKQGSTPPQTPDDGSNFVIGTNLATNYDVTGLTNGMEYRAKIYAYKTVGSIIIFSSLQSPTSYGTFTPTAVVSAGTISSQVATPKAGRKVELTWFEPTGSWSKTVIKRKKDSYPTNDTDGDTIIENITQDAYKSNPLKDTTPDVGDYYYKAFTYNNSVITDSPLNNFTKVTTFEKLNRQAPLSPQLVAKTSRGITITHSAGPAVRVYRSDQPTTLSTVPQSYAATPNTSYKFYAVYPEDETHNQSPPSVSLDITSDKDPGQKSDPPVLNYEYYNSTTDKWALGFTAAYPANIDKTAIQLSGSSWRTDKSDWVFPNLPAGNNYAAYAKFIENETTSEGLPSNPLNVTTKKVKPNKPSIIFISDNSVTVTTLGDSLSVGVTGKVFTQFQLIKETDNTIVTSPESDTLNSYEFKSLSPNTDYIVKVINVTSYDLAGGTTLSSVAGEPLEFTTPPIVTVGGVRVFKNESDPFKKVAYIGALAGCTPAFRNPDNTININSSLGAELGSMFPTTGIVTLKSNGESNILQTNDLTKKQDGSPSNLTGTDGDVMVKLSKVYWKITDEGEASYRIEMSRTQQSGFDCYAHKKATGEVSDIYVGVYPAYKDGAKLRSISGVTPTTNLTPGEFYAAAVDNGMELMTVQTLTLLQIMFMMLFKTTDSSIFGIGYNVGSTLQTTGVRNIGAPNYGGGTTTDRIKFWGLEDFWGHIGYIIGNVYLNYGSQATEGAVYTTYGAYSPNSPSGYTRNTLSIRPSLNSGFIKNMEVKNEYGFFPSNTGASSSTHYCDLGVIPSLNGANKFMYFGGDGIGGSSWYTGIFSSQWQLIDTSKFFYVGARIQRRGATI